MKLWSINRVLRWTGFRLCVTVSPHIERPSETVDALVSAMCKSSMLQHTHNKELGPVARLDLRDRFVTVLKCERKPTEIAVIWYGLPGSKGWANIEPGNKTPIRSALGLEP